MIKKKCEKLKEEENDLLMQGFKYVTRAKHGELVAHKTLPIKQSNFWHSDYRRRPLPQNTKFTFVRWEDKPYVLTKNEIKRKKVI